MRIIFTVLLNGIGQRNNPYIVSQLAIRGINWSIHHRHVDQLIDTQPLHMRRILQLFIFVDSFICTQQ